VRKLFGGNLRWVLIFLTFLISSLAYMDRVNISIAAPFLQREYGLSNVQLGWVFSAFVLGYALFQAPFGRFADRFGPRVAIALAIAWWSVFTLFTALVPAGAMALALLIAVRFSLGVGEAVMYPASNRLVATWIPSAERGRANGLIFAGVGAGSALAPPFITYVIANWGWRWSFYLRVPIGLVAVLVWWWIIRDSPQSHPWIEKREVESIQAGLPVSSGGPGASKALPWTTILANKSMLAMSLSYTAFGYVAWIFFTWFFIYLNRVRHLDLKSSAFFSMLPFLAMAVGCLTGGWIGDWLTKRYNRHVGRNYVALASLLLAAVFIAFGTQLASPKLASVILAGGAGAVYLSLSSFWAVTADIAGVSAGTASGLLNMGCQLGGALTASLTPWIADHFGWTPSFLVAAVLCVLAALAWLVVDPDSPIGQPSTAAR
jgi:ACS family glucarate transporter-like MFS transporter